MRVGKVEPDHQLKSNKAMRKINECKICGKRFPADRKLREIFGVKKAARGFVQIVKCDDCERSEKSICCGAPLIGGAQCETCGADGRPETAQDKGSPEYPLGGMVEPYDVEREKEMLNH